MTREERRSLFEGCMPSTRAAIRLDGNEALFEQAWLATDGVEFMARLHDFAIGLGCTTLRFHPGRGPKVIDRIASDVRLVTQRIGWHWCMWRVEVRGRA